MKRVADEPMLQKYYAEKIKERCRDLRIEQRTDEIEQLFQNK